MKSAVEGASHWRRSLLGIGSVSIMALVLALAAVLGLIEPEVAVEGCIALGALAGVFHALLRFGYSERFSAAGFVSAQLAAVFVLLAWLTYRAEDTPSASSELQKRFKLSERQAEAILNMRLAKLTGLDRKSVV